MLGITKLKLHIINTIAKILDSFTWYKEKIKNATDPFTTTSNKESIGIIDAIKYIEKMHIIASR